MKLPNVENAMVPQENIVGYLLNPEHPDGAGKAKFFGAIGFVPEQRERLAKALQRIAADNDVLSCAESRHGRKYIVDGPLATDGARPPLVRTVWIIDAGRTVPRLVTAYPYEPV